MSNADSMKTGGSNSAVGPVLMKKIALVTIELKDIVIDEERLYEKVYCKDFGNYPLSFTRTNNSRDIRIGLF